MRPGSPGMKGKKPQEPTASESAGPEKSGRPFPSALKSCPSPWSRGNVCQGPERPLRPFLLGHLENALGKLITQNTGFQVQKPNVSWVMLRRDFSGSWHCKVQAELASGLAEGLYFRLFSQRLMTSSHWIGWVTCLPLHQSQ